MPDFAAHAVATRNTAICLSPCCRNTFRISRALKAADDALELFKLYHLGVAEKMERSG
jgi:hypothetical protein